jgi:hypothetical protein
MVNLPLRKPVTGRSDKKNQPKNGTACCYCTRMANCAIPKIAENMDDAGAPVIGFA